MTSNAAVKVLEKLSVYTPLGIRFWDPVRNEQIRDGLRLIAWNTMGWGRVAVAYRTRSDIYAFQGLPGLRDLEYGATQADPPLGSPQEQRRFVVLVEDSLNRFLPAARAIDLPLPYRGVFPRNGIHSPAESSPPGFLLFSSVSRSRPSWLAGIRGALLDSVSGRAAAHAVVNVRIAGHEIYGLSDADGRFVVYLPYPAITEDLNRSPSPALGLGSIFNQSWAVELRVFYQPNKQTALPRTNLPDYLSILTQPRADVWVQLLDAGTDPAESWAGVLEYGQELNVKTMGEQHLLISPRISP